MPHYLERQAGFGPGGGSRRLSSSRAVEPAEAGLARLAVELPRLPCDFGAGARALGQLKGQTQVLPGEVDEETGAIVGATRAESLRSRMKLAPEARLSTSPTVWRSTPRRSATPSPRRARPGW